MATKEFKTHMMYKKGKKPVEVKTKKKHDRIKEKRLRTYEA